MINVVHAEEGVTGEMQMRVKSLLQDNLVLMYENDYPGALQTLMKNELGGLWTILILRGVEDFEALLSSKD
jgi:hypothetical protein